MVSPLLQPLWIESHVSSLHIKMRLSFPCSKFPRLFSASPVALFSSAYLRRSRIDVLHAPGALKLFYGWRRSCYSSLFSACSLRSCLVLVLSVFSTRQILCLRHTRALEQRYFLVSPLFVLVQPVRSHKLGDSN